MDVLSLADMAVAIDEGMDGLELCVGVAQLDDDALIARMDSAGERREA